MLKILVLSYRALIFIWRHGVHVGGGGGQGYFRDPWLALFAYRDLRKYNSVNKKMRFVNLKDLKTWPGHLNLINISSLPNWNKGQIAKIFPTDVFKNVTKRKRIYNVYYNWMQFSIHIFRVLKWFKNHHIRYLSSFAAISVLDFKIAYKRRYPNLSFSHVFLFEIIPDYLQNTSSNILKFPRNLVSAYQNEI